MLSPEEVKKHNRKVFEKQANKLYEKLHVFAVKEMVDRKKPGSPLPKIDPAKRVWKRPEWVPTVSPRSGARKTANPFQPDEMREYRRASWASVKAKG